MRRVKKSKTVKWLAAVISAGICFSLCAPGVLADLGGTEKKLSCTKESKIAETVAGKKQIEENDTEELKLYARSAVLMDAESGRILVGKEENKVLPMASTTKIMTCILVLEQGGEKDIYEVSSYAAGMPKVKLGVSVGEEYYGRDLLYSLMLESHNDAAVILAEGVCGSVEAFADKMNEKAKEIGCRDTHFVTPNGLDADEHYTTAADLARIMRYCIKESPKKEEFLKITQTRSYTFSDVKGKRSFSCQNHNAFLDMMDGALSGKTGFTGKAGYCYVGALSREGKTFIVSLLACGWPNNKTYKWKDTKTLMEYGLTHYEIRDVWREVTTDPLLVIDGIPPSGDLKEKVTVKTGMDMAKEEKTLPLLLSALEDVTVNIEIQKTVHAPIEKGTCVGMVEYLLDGEVVKKVPVIAMDSVEKADFFWCLRETWLHMLI